MASTTSLGELPAVCNRSFNKPMICPSLTSTPSIPTSRVAVVISMVSTSPAARAITRALVSRSA